MAEQITIDKQRSTDAVNTHVGKKIRIRRSALALPQHFIAEKLGISYQQVQKYEKGTNRISASRLYFIAECLHVPVSYFYEDMPRTTNAIKLPDDLFPNLKHLPNAPLETAIRDLIDTIVNKARP